MTVSLSTGTRRGIRPIALIGLAGVGGLVAAAVALWAHYGTAVFVEMIQAGISACF